MVTVKGGGGKDLDRTAVQLADRQIPLVAVTVDGAVASGVQHLRQLRFEYGVARRCRRRLTVPDEKADVVFLPFEETSEYTKKFRKKAIKDKDPHFESYGDKLILVNKINDFMYAATKNLFLIKLINQNIWIKFEKDIETFPLATPEEARRLVRRLQLEQRPATR